MTSETEVKKLITSVLCSSPTGLTIKRLDVDFKNLVGLQIPYKKFGYPTLESYLRSIPDVCEVLGSGDYAILNHVVTKNLEHINSLILNQKKSSGSKRHFLHRRPIGIRKTPTSGDKIQRSVTFNLNNQYNSSSSDYLSESSSNSSKCSNYIDNSYSKESNCNQTDEQKYNNEKANVVEKKKLTKRSDILKYCVQKMKTQHQQETSYIGFNQNNHSSVTEDIKIKLRSIIEKFPEGLACHKLNQLYLTRFQKDLNPFDFNMHSISELCSSLENDVFHVIRSNSSDLVLFDARLPKPDIENLKESNPYNKDEYPPNVLILGETYEAQQLSFGFSMSDFIPIKIVNIIDLSNFYFVYEFSEQFLSTQKMYNDAMQSFYEDNYKQYVLRKKHILKGLQCVVRTNIFYRASIIKSESDKIEVFLQDYGKTVLVDSNNIFYLFDDFSIYSQRQAIHGCLSFLKPVESDKWCNDSIMRFKELTINKELMGQITNIDKSSGKIHLIITDVTEPDVDIIINDTLIDEDLAAVI